MPTHNLGKCISSQNYFFHLEMNFTEFYSLPTLLVHFTHTGLDLVLPSEQPDFIATCFSGSGYLIKTVIIRSLLVDAIQEKMFAAVISVHTAESQKVWVIASLNLGEQW